MGDRKVKVVLSAEVSEYSKAMKQAAAYTSYVGSEAEKLAQKRQAFERLGRGLLVTGAALTAVTALAVKAAIDWESAWTGVTKTVDGSAEEMAELEDQLRSLATTLPATHEEIAAVAEAAGQLGVAREDVAAFTKTMIDLSETTNLTADEAATSIAQFMNIFQTAPEDVDNLGAALVALGNDGASTERDIIQMSQRLAGAATIIGLTEGETLGLANALASVGIEADAGGSAVSNIMIDIANAVSQKGSKLLEWSKLAGLGADEFAEKYRTKPAEALSLVIEGMGKLNDVGGDVFGTLSALGQTDVRVTRALLGLASSGDLLRNSLELGNEAWEDNIALIEEARKRYDTTEARMQIAGNSIRDAAIDLGDVFLPAVKAASDGVASLAQLFGDLPEPVQGIVGVLGGVAGVATLIGGAALLAVPKIVEFRIALQTLQTTAGRLAFIGGGVTLALTALVTVVGTLAIAQAQAQARAENYADALKQGGTAARDLVIQNLAVEKTLLGFSFGSAYDNAEKLGIGLDLVTDAASGNAKAMKDLQKILDTATNGGDAAKDMADDLGISLLDLSQSAGTLQEQVKEQTDGLARGTEIQKQTKEATDATTDAMTDATTATEDNTVALEDLQGVAKDTTEDVDALADAIRNFGKKTFDTEGASISFEQALDDLDEAIKDSAGSLDVTTEAGRNTRQAMLDVASSTNDYAASVAAMGGSTEEVEGILESGRQKIIDTRIALGDTEEAAREYADQLIATPETVETQVELNGIAAAQAALTRFKDTFNGIPNYKGVTVDTILGNPSMRSATGGPVVGPGTGTSDSIHAMLSNGEHVWTAAEVAAAGGHGAVEDLRRWVKTGQGFPTVTQGAGSSPPTAIYVQNPFTGEYLLAQTAAVADSRIVSAATAQDRFDDAGRRRRY